MASEELGTEYLCDILYADRERLSSYLAQIDPNGIITGYKTSTTDASGVATSFKGSAAVASASATGTLSNQELAERTFDPAAALPIEVMNRLDEANFINKNVVNAPVGSLTLVKGSISLRDFSQFNSFWPILKKVMPIKLFASYIPKLDHGATITTNDIETSIKTLLETTPYPIQMTLKGTQGEFWSTLGDDNFIISTIDLFLKHTKDLPGEWFVLGVVDGHPDESSQDDKSDEDNEGDFLEKLHNGLAMFRSLFGRPDRCYGISPLIIFRKVKKVASYPS